MIDDLLGAIGIRTAEALASQLDFWSLYPWRHSLPVWRAVFGATTDDLVQRGVLRRVQLKAVPHPDHPTAGRVLRVEPIAEGDFHGVSEVAEVPSRALSATDIEGLELAPERFRQYLREALGITEGGVVWSAGGDVLELDWFPVGDERLYLAYTIRQPSRHLGSRLRVRANGAHVLLLVPATQPDEFGLATVMLSSAIPSNHQIIRDGSAACGFADQLPAIVRAPDGAELVVDTRLKKVWVYRNEVQQLSRDSQLFQFVKMLAESNGASVTFAAITQALSAARLQTDGTTTARQAKFRAKKPIVDELKAAGAADSSDPFPSGGTGCYRCRLRSFVE